MIEACTAQQRISHKAIKRAQIRSGTPQDFKQSLGSIEKPTASANLIKLRTSQPNGRGYRVASLTKIQVLRPSTRSKRARQGHERTVFNDRLQGNRESRI